MWKKLLIGCGVIFGMMGCGEPTMDCAAIPDGVYRSAAGDEYAFVGGGVTGWLCSAAPVCPGTVTCAPPAETVYTVAFERSGDGLLATISPPDRTVVLVPVP